MNGRVLDRGKEHVLPYAVMKNHGPMDVKTEVLKAEKQIRRFIRETPLEYSPYLSRLADCHVYLKLENLQLTCSFKYRGAVNKILSLDAPERKKGVITSSSGNHGAAFTYAAKKLGCKATLYLPENISPAKLEPIRLYGGEDIVFYGTDVAETEKFARQAAEKSGCLYISAYNDPKIIGGQGTVAVELMRQMKNMDAVFVPIGGGGLMSGIAGYLKTAAPHVKIIGCQPENSPVMTESVKAGRIIEMVSKPTLADGSAGGIEPGSITFPLCREYVDEYVLVSEAQLEEALTLSLEKNHLLIEGAAALSLAAFLKTRELYKKNQVALIISGRKISLAALRKILCRAREGN